eukprot:EG_transcript_5027
MQELKADFFALFWRNAFPYGHQRTHKNEALFISSTDLKLNYWGPEKKNSPRSFAHCICLQYSTQGREWRGARFLACLFAPFFSFDFYDTVDSSCSLVLCPPGPFLAHLRPGAQDQSSSAL